VRGNADMQGLERALKALATAVRSTRLYPPSSPIPMQSAQAAAAAFSESLPAGTTGLVLDVAREGFSCGGTMIGSAMPSVAELADVLREHAVAAMTLVPPLPAEEILAFVRVLTRPIAEIRAVGGFGAALTRHSIEHLRVTGVRLAAAEATESAAAVETDLKTWLQGLGSDAGRLSTWFATASSVITTSDVGATSSQAATPL